MQNSLLGVFKSCQYSIKYYFQPIVPVSSDFRGMLPKQMRTRKHVDLLCHTPLITEIWEPGEYSIYRAAKYLSPVAHDGHCHFHSVHVPTAMEEVGEQKVLARLPCHWQNGALNSPQDTSHTHCPFSAEEDVTSLSKESFGFTAGW